MPYILKVILKKHHFDKFCLIVIDIFRKMKPKKNGGGQKGSRTSFSPVTYTNVGISPRNFLTFSFNPFATLV